MTEPTAPNELAEDPMNLFGKGHNNPPEELPYDPAVLAELKTRTDRFTEVSDQWVKIDVTSEKLAGQLTDQINGLREAIKAVDKARTEQKKPHLDAGRDVDAAFNPLKDLLDRSLGKLRPKMEAYLTEKQAREDAERAAREAEAAKEAEQARLAALDAQESGKIADEAEAEAKLAEAKKKAAAVSKPAKAKVQSASGASKSISTRSRRQCDVHNIRALFLHFQDRDEVKDLLTRLANAEANAAGFTDDDKIPGVTITKKTTIA